MIVWYEQCVLRHVGVIFYIQKNGIGLVCAPGPHKSIIHSCFSQAHDKIQFLNFVSNSCNRKSNHGWFAALSPRLLVLRSPPWKQPHPLEDLLTKYSFFHLNINDIKGICKFSSNQMHFRMRMPLPQTSNSLKRQDDPLTSCFNSNAVCQHTKWFQEAFKTFNKSKTLLKATRLGVSFFKPLHQTAVPSQLYRT